MQRFSRIIEPIYRLMRPCKHRSYTSSTDTTSYRDFHQQQLTQWEHLLLLFTLMQWFLSLSGCRACTFSWSMKLHMHGKQRVHRHYWPMTVTCV